MDFLQQFSFLYDRIAAFFTGDGWKNLVMLIIGGVLIYLALVKFLNRLCCCQWASARFWSICPFPALSIR